MLIIMWKQLNGSFKRFGSELGRGWAGPGTKLSIFIRAWPGSGQNFNFSFGPGPKFLFLLSGRSGPKNPAFANTRLSRSTRQTRSCKQFAVKCRIWPLKTGFSSLKLFTRMVNSRSSKTKVRQCVWDSKRNKNLFIKMKNEFVDMNKQPWWFLVYTRWCQTPTDLEKILKFPWQSFGFVLCWRKRTGYWLACLFSWFALPGLFSVGATWRTMYKKIIHNHYMLIIRQAISAEISGNTVPTIRSILDNYHLRLRHIVASIGMHFEILLH